MKTRVFRSVVAAAFAAGLWALAPEYAAACKSCFGAGSDPAMVRAIGASMLVLIGLMGFMGGGIFSFFKRSAERAAVNLPGNQNSDD
jgi:hypothetical protein